MLETKKSVEKSQDSLNKLEQSIVQSINSLKNEMINHSYEKLTG